MENRDSVVIINSLFGKDIKYQTKNEKEFLIDFSNEILRPYSFESPDLILSSEKTIYAIEHFEVSNTATTKKGDIFKQKYESDFFNNSHISYGNSENIEIKYYSGKSSDSIGKYKKVSLKYDYLFSNFKNIFGNHYSKFEKYIENINNNFTNKDILFFFFIEYTSPLPTYVRNKEGELKFFYPHMDKRIHEILKNSPKLKGIFFKDDNGILFMLNSERSLQNIFTAELDDLYFVEQNNFNIQSLILKRKSNNTHTE